MLRRRLALAGTAFGLPLGFDLALRLAGFRTAGFRYFLCAFLRSAFNLLIKTRTSFSKAIFWPGLDRIRYVGQRTNAKFASTARC